MKTMQMCVDKLLHQDKPHLAQSVPFYQHHQITHLQTTCFTSTSAHTHPKISTSPASSQPLLQVIFAAYQWLYWEDLPFFLLPLLSRPVVVSNRSPLCSTTAFHSLSSSALMQTRFPS